MTLIQETARAISILREKSPLIHCITNYVTAGDTANMLLAAGASPMMADDPEECAEVTAAANGLVLNLGTPSAARVQALLNSGRRALQHGIPVVFDPVGVGMTALRRSAAAKILSEVKPCAIRGNLSETAYLAGIPMTERGVDSADSGISPEETALSAARKLGCVCAVTGAYDVICDGERRIVIRNGTPLLRQVTGAGCMTSALCAAFASVCGAFTGTAAGIAFMDVCGEIAAERSDGLGGFHAALFDAAGSVTPEILMERLDMHEC
ncbi:MAG: hydroxyethylthiazole kinase [Oscillospiraceae bacterium]|nr:hydroxyethylthiazole kinase [Oscillospiraceae bacterium]